MTRRSASSLPSKPPVLQQENHAPCGGVSSGCRSIGSGKRLGQLLAEEDFPRSVQVRYRAVAESIREAFRNRITRLEWMSDATKQRALLKLARMTVTIGLEQKG